MIPHEQEKTKCLSNMEGGTNFTIKASSKMYKILSSGLYSNKIKAVVREVSCNAVDANVDAGNGDVPIVVHLPNNLEPFFSIKDSGTGLTPDQMVHIYTSYGTSTKTDRNDQIGALGLGSKSPFSYVDQFTVTTIVDGMKYTYSAFLNGEGEPRLQPFGDGEQTDEVNGVEVSFPVKEEDFDSFRHEAEVTFRPFEVKPEIVGNSNCKIKGFNVLLEGNDKDWQLVEDNHETSWKRDKIQVAVQGNIEYPINTDIIEKHLDAKKRKLARENFRLMFPIGDLDIAASREELGYDKVTIDNIVKMFEKVAGEIADTVNEKLTEFTNEYEAKQYLADMRNTTNFYRYFEYEWKGKKLDSHFTLKTALEMTKYERSYRRQGISRSVMGNGYGDTWNYDVPTSTSTTIYVYNDNDKKGQATTKARSLVTANNTVYLIDDSKMLKALKLRKKDYLNASEIEGVSRGMTTGGRSSGSFFKRFNTNYSYSKYWFDTNYTTADSINLELDEEFYYVELNSKTVKNYEPVYEYRRLAIELGYIKEDTVIYGVSVSHAGTTKFKTYKGVNFVEVMKEKFNKSTKVKAAFNVSRIKDRIRGVKWDLSGHYGLMNDATFMDSINNDNYKTTLNDINELRDSIKDINETIIDCINSISNHLTLKRKDIKEIDTSWISNYPLIQNGAEVEEALEYIHALDMFRKQKEA